MTKDCHAHLIVVALAFKLYSKLQIMLYCLLKKNSNPLIDLLHVFEGGDIADDDAFCIYRVVKTIIDY